MLPPLPPQATLDQVRQWIEQHQSQLRADDHVIVLAKRGYYARTMGPTPLNDRGIYDDACFIVSPTHFSSWNFNVDPSVHRDGVASLVAGVHRYKRGLHGVSFRRPGYPIPAFIPAAAGKRVPVTRDGQQGQTTGVALNIHPGGRTTTSSLGCLTVPPPRWAAYYAALDGQLTQHRRQTFPVILMD